MTFRLNILAASGWKKLVSWPGKRLTNAKVDTPERTTFLNLNAETRLFKATIPQEAAFLKKIWKSREFAFYRLTLSDVFVYYSSLRGGW